jgi:hypothetical protein
MGRLEEYVEAVTRRLRPDAELHMDVAHEVRVHIEDAAEDARERGLGEEEALDAALKAFGDKEQMADALWEANRRRMRLRAVIKWALRATLVPAALAVSVYVCGTYFIELCQVTELYGGLMGGGGWRVLPRMELPAVRPRSDLTPEERFVFDHVRESSSDEGIASAMALVDRYPANPSFYAQYVKLLSVRRYGERKTGEDELAWALPMLDRGEQVEPDNAYYNYFKAGLLMERSSTLETKQGICFSYTDQNGQEKKDCGDNLTITDPATFEKALQEVYKGLRKPYCNTRSADAVELKLSLGEAPSTLAEDLTNLATTAASLMPRLSLMRGIGRRLPPYASLLLSEGDKEGAAQLLQVMERPGIQMGPDAQTVIELFVAEAMLRVTGGQAPVVYETLGMPAEAVEARLRFEKENELWNSLYANQRSEEAAFRDAQKYYGVFYIGVAPGVPGMDHSILGRPYALLEHAVVEEITLGFLLAALIVTALILGAATCWNLWKHRRDGDKPKVFFVGWRRLGWIVLASLCIPVGLYLAYTRLMPFSSMAYGIHYAFGPFVLELSALLVLISFTLMATSYRAIRQRCQDAGMEVPADDFFMPFRRPAVVVGTFLLGGFVVLVIVTTKQGGLSRNVGLAVVSSAITVGAVFYLRHQLSLLRRGYGSRGPSLGALLRVVAAIACTIFALCAGFFCVALARRPVEAGLAVVIAAVAVVAFWYVFLGGRRRPERQPASPKTHFQMTFLRSLVPILTLCLLVLGLSGNAYLRSAEAAQTRKLHETALHPFEFEMAGFKPYQDHLRELNREWLQSHQDSGQRPH